MTQPNLRRQKRFTRPGAARPGWMFFLALLLVTTTTLQMAGVRRDIQHDYRSRHLNRTVFLKLPLSGARQILMVRPGGVTPVEGPARTKVTFLVGEQIRVTDIKFSGQEIRFEVSSIDLSRQNELVFRFIHELGNDFPERTLFETALDKTFTKGLTNREIGEARSAYLKREFNRTVGELSRISNTSREFVLKSIEGEIPGVAAARSQAQRSASEAAALKDRLEEERTARGKAQGEVTRLRKENAGNENAIDELKQERERFSDDNQRLQREVSRLKDVGEGYKRQIAQLARNLDVSSDSKDSMSRNLAQLNQNVESLKRRVDETELELQKKTQENQQLAGDLDRTKAERDRLKRNLRGVTSDSKSLGARFVEVNRAKERLENADRLYQALQVQPRGNDPSLLQADLLLGEHKIGHLELPKPSASGQDYTLQFALDSPDTVQFDEEERRLYAALGEKTRLEARWETSGPGLKISLTEGEDVRALAPREDTSWTWRFEGDLASPETATLKLMLLTADDLPVPMWRRDFELQPSGLLSGGGGFSLLWLGVGALLGIAVMLPVLFFRTQPSRKAPARSRGKSRPSDPAAEMFSRTKKF